MKNNFKRQRWVVFSLLFVTVLGGGPLIGIKVYYIAYPPDRVLVHIGLFPDDVVFQCMIVEDDEGSVSTLYWSTPGIVPPPNPMHPNRASWSGVNDEEKQLGFHNYVQWKPGNRYGVVTLTKRNRWLVYWFAPNPARVFDLAKVKPVPLAPEDVRSLGLSRVRATPFGWDNDGPAPAGMAP